jgi:hypothetical protein
MFNFFDIITTPSKATVVEEESLPSQICYTEEDVDLCIEISTDENKWTSIKIVDTAHTVHDDVDRYYHLAIKCTREQEFGEIVTVKASLTNAFGSEKMELDSGYLDVPGIFQILATRLHNRQIEDFAKKIATLVYMYNAEEDLTNLCRDSVRKSSASN